MEEDFNSVAEQYYEEIVKSNNPIPIIVRMYRALFGIAKQSDFARFGKLVKLYGWNLVFESLMDSYLIYDENNKGNPLNLITAVIKNNYKSRMAKKEYTIIIDAKRLRRDVTKTLKVGDPFNEST